MILAADRLASGRETIATLAPALGYESESAFSTAFKRVMGCAPRHYGRGGTTPLPALVPA
jgi:AraC-like DNA-binding protein